MPIAISADQTPIFYETAGNGPSLVLVDGALCTRTIGPSRGLARRLSTNFTVARYDRRGRGESGDASTWAAAREVDDLLAIIAAVGGEAYVFGQSSGAILALHAATRSSSVVALALHEPPFIVDDSRPATQPTFCEQLVTLLAQDRRGAAVTRFLEFVGLPRAAIAALRLTPVWPGLVAIAHTLPYDAHITFEHQQGVAIPPERWSLVAQPALVLSGGKSPEWMRNGAVALAESLAKGSHEELPRQTHNLRPRVVAPRLAAYFGRQVTANRPRAEMPLSDGER